jgi:hypothetical protein
MRLEWRCLAEQFEQPDDCSFVLQRHNCKECHLWRQTLQSGQVRGLHVQCCNIDHGRGRAACQGFPLFREQMNQQAIKALRRLR